MCKPWITQSLNEMLGLGWFADDVDGEDALPDDGVTIISTPKPNMRGIA